MINILKKLGVIIIFAFIVIILQWVVGEALIALSSWLYPRQVTFIGMLGAALMPHPLMFGLYIWPITAAILYFGYKKYGLRNPVKGRR
jgi:hypothetical protein